MLKNTTIDAEKINSMKIDDSSEFMKREELLKTPDYYKLLYENCPLPYQTLDEKGRIIDVNEAWLEMLQYSKKDEIIGTWFGDYVAKECLACFKEKYYTFKKEGEMCCQELTILKKDKTKLDITLYGKISYSEKNKFSQTHCILVISLLQFEEEKEKYDQNIFYKNCINDLQALDYKNIYDFIGNKFHEISGTLSVICSYNEINKTLKVEKISGLDNFYNKLLKTIQRDPSSIQFIMNENDLNNLLSGELYNVKGTFIDYTQEALTKPISYAVEKLFATKEIYSIGFSYKNKVLGSGTIITTERKKLKNKEIIEDFSSFISLMLSKN